MPWQAGLFVLKEGATVRIDFSWQGKYKGPQYALARPLLDLGPLVLGAVTGERSLNTTDHGLTGRRRDAEAEVEWIYHVTVRNIDSKFATFFELTGGEVEPSGT